jgi:chemotaxis protein histidine kinase CheA
MTGSPELLEFYLVEATEYLDALDQLVAGTGTSPDGNALIATARALRGASSMAKVAPVEGIAMAIEQIAHGLRDGDIRWTLDLYRVLRDTVDDLRVLVRAVRTWGERETARADARQAELQRFLPGITPRAAAPAAAATAPVFIALQSSAIAAELDAFVANPRHRRALDDALTRARTLRGVAGIGDYPPLADVADAIDRTARTLMPDAPLAPADVELFRSAADVLRQTSSRLREGRPADPRAPEVARFAHAVSALADASASAFERPPIVRIDELFYADPGPHILQRAVSPPVTRDQRFRDEMVSRAEHLRRLVADARAVRDPAGEARAGRVLRDALGDLQTVAASFDVHQVASFFGEAAREEDVLAPALLDAIDGGALLLIAPGESVDEIERRLAVLERSRRATPVVSPRAVAPALAVPPVAVPPVAVPPVAAPPVAAPPVATASPLPHSPRVPVTTSLSSASPDASATSAAAAASAASAAAGTASAEAAAAPQSPAPVPPASGTAAGAPAHRRPPPTPTGRELQDLLQVGIAGFQSLDDEPLSAPARLDEDDIVPIESLLYRGQSAIARAVEVRDEMRARGHTDDATLQEIFDLLDLAQAE